MCGITCMLIDKYVRALMLGNVYLIEGKGALFHPFFKIRNTFSTYNYVNFFSPVFKDNF